MNTQENIDNSSPKTSPKNAPCDNTEPRQIKRRKPRPLKPTPIQAKIIDVTQQHPELSLPQIAAIADTSHVHVLNTLRRYGIDRERLEDYKTNRADILAGIQNRVLQSITDDSINNATLSARATLFGILTDKERLERGLSTSNVAFAGLSDADIDQEIQRLTDRLNVIDITPEPNNNQPITNNKSLISAPSDKKHGVETNQEGQ